eukprot:symbB.v1.2.026741.t1/scaffold2694.1/size91562/17
MSHGEHVHLTEVGQDDHEDCDSGADGDADDNDEHGPMVGGLILRENHCVLIRSLTGEWDGMRLPWAAADKDEASTDAALRIASELCEIETNQIRILEDLAPVTVAVPGMPILIHALYAVDPPPADFVPDIEDPEDVYDWYTFPRAMSALAKDPYARAALVTMACALAAASGIVPTTGGIFGQEWTIPAFRMLPDPGKEKK